MRKNERYLVAVLLLFNLIGSEGRHFPKHHRRKSHERFNIRVSSQVDNEYNDVVGDAHENDKQVMNEFNKRESPVYKNGYQNIQNGVLNNNSEMPFYDQGDSSRTNTPNFTSSTAKPHVTTSSMYSGISTKRFSSIVTTKTTGKTTTAIHLTKGSSKSETNTTHVTSKSQVNDEQAATNISEGFHKVKLMVAATKVKADLQSLIDAALNVDDSIMNGLSSDAPLPDVIQTTNSHIKTSQPENKEQISLTSTPATNIFENSIDSSDQTLKSAESKIESDVHTLLGILSDEDNKTTVHTTPFTGTTTIGTQTTPKPFPGEYQGYIPVTKAERSVVLTPLPVRNMSSLHGTNQSAVLGKLTHHHMPHGRKHKKKQKTKTELHHLPVPPKSPDVLEKHRNIAYELSVINENILNGMLLLKLKLKHLNTKLRKALRDIGDKAADNTNEERTDIKVNSDRIAQLQQGLEGKIDDLRYNITLLTKSQKELAETMTWSMENMMGMLSHMVDKVTDTEGKQSTAPPETSKFTKSTEEMVTGPTKTFHSDLAGKDQVFNKRNGGRKVKRSHGTSVDYVTHSILETTTPVLITTTMEDVIGKLISEQNSVKESKSARHLDYHKLFHKDRPHTHRHGNMPNHGPHTHKHGNVPKNRTHTHTHENISNHRTHAHHKHGNMSNHGPHTHAHHKHGNMSNHLGKLTHHHMPHGRKHKKKQKTKTELHHLPVPPKSPDVLEKHRNIAYELSVINENILNGMLLLKLKLKHLNTKLRKALRDIGDKAADNTNEERTDIKVNSDRIAQLQQGLEGKIDDLRYNITLLTKSQKELAETMTWSMEKMMGMLSHMVDKVTDTEGKQSTAPPETSKFTKPTEEMVTGPTKTFHSDFAGKDQVFNKRNGGRKVKRSHGTSVDYVTHSILETTTPVLITTTMEDVIGKLISEQNSVKESKSARHLDYHKLFHKDRPHTHRHGNMPNHGPHTHKHGNVPKNRTHTHKHENISNHRTHTHKHSNMSNHGPHTHAHHKHGNMSNHRSHTHKHHKHGNMSNHGPYTHEHHKHGNMSNHGPHTHAHHKHGNMSNHGPHTHAHHKHGNMSNHGPHTHAHHKHGNMLNHRTHTHKHHKHGNMSNHRTHTHKYHKHGNMLNHRTHTHKHHKHGNMSNHRTHSHKHGNMSGHRTHTHKHGKITNHRTHEHGKMSNHLTKSQRTKHHHL